MSARTVIVGLCLSCAGCLEVEQVTYRFDLVTGKGSMIFQGITSDEATNVWGDFATLINDYVLGDALTRDRPGWRVEERKLFEHEGELRGVFRFSFGNAEDVGLYKHDKKSAWLWCAESDKVVTATNGQVVGPYPHCVMFDRKTKDFHVTVRSEDKRGEMSLLPPFATWQGGPFDGKRPGSAPGVMGMLPDVAATGLWKELGFPMDNSKIVHVTDRSYAAAHEGTVPEAAVVLYANHLVAQGFGPPVATGEANVVVRDAQRIAITATEAGSTAVVSLALSSTTPEGAPPAP